MIQKSYCCEVDIGQQTQAQCNGLAFRVITQGRRIQEGDHIPPVLANHSLEEKAKGLWFLVFEKTAKLCKVSDDAYFPGRLIIFKDILDERVVERVPSDPHDFTA